MKICKTLFSVQRFLQKCHTSVFISLDNILAVCLSPNEWMLFSYIMENFYNVFGSVSGLFKRIKGDFILSCGIFTHLNICINIHYFILFKNINIENTFSNYQSLKGKSGDGFMIAHCLVYPSILINSDG